MIELPSTGLDALFSPSSIIPRLITSPVKCSLCFDGQMILADNFFYLLLLTVCPEGKLSVVCHTYSIRFSLSLFLSLHFSKFVCVYVCERIRTHHLSIVRAFSS